VDIKAERKSVDCVLPSGFAKNFVLGEVRHFESAEQRSANHCARTV